MVVADREEVVYADHGEEIEVGEDDSAGLANSSTLFQHGIPNSGEHLNLFARRFGIH